MGDTPASTSPTANALCASYDTPVWSVYNLTCATPVTGRYLVVHLRPVGDAFRPSGSYLSLCEVKAFGSLPAPSLRQVTGSVCAPLAA